MDAKQVQQKPVYTKKVPRDVELKNQIRVAEAKLKQDVANLQADIKKKREKALLDSAIESGRLGKTCREKVAEHKKLRDDVVRKAHKDYDAAVRKAQSERDKAVRTAEEVFASARDFLDKQLAEDNAPVRQRFEQTEAVLATEAKEKVDLLVTSYTELINPLKEELKALEEKAAAKTVTTNQ